MQKTLTERLLTGALLLATPFAVISSGAQQKASPVVRLTAGSRLIHPPVEISSIEDNLSNLRLTDTKSINALNSATTNLRHATGQEACHVLAVGTRLHSFQIINGKKVVGPSDVSEDQERRENEGLKAELCGKEATAKAGTSSQNIPALLKYAGQVYQIAMTAP